MIFTKALTYDEIKQKLDKDDVISIIGCSSCARVAGTGGEEQMEDLAKNLRKDGYNVQEGFSINTVCTPKVFQARLNRKVNTIITMACSAGFANVSSIFADKKIITSSDDIGLMAADIKNETIHVAVPFEKHKETKGEKFKMYSGEALNEASVKKNREDQ